MISLVMSKAASGFGQGHRRPCSRQEAQPSVRKPLVLSQAQTFISCRSGFICSPPRVHTSPSPLTSLHTPFLSPEGLQGPHPSPVHTPLTFHRRCADKAGLWGTGTDPGRCCTPGTACPSAGPPGQGCLPFSPWCPRMAPATHTSLYPERWSVPEKPALPSSK